MTFTRPPSVSAKLFLQTGKPPSTERERNALLDELRSALSEAPAAWVPPTDPALLEAFVAESKAAKVARDKAVAAAQVKAETALAAMRAARLKQQPSAASKPAAVLPKATTAPTKAASPSPAKQLSREAFSKLTPSEKMTFAKNGGRIEVEPTSPKASRAPVKPTPAPITREDFRKLSSAARSAHVKSGGKITE